MQSHKDDQILYSRTKETMENWKTKTFSIDHPAQHISSVWENIIRESVELQSRHYIDLPYPKFSERFGGIRKGEVVVFGGRPSMGKTNVLIHLALHISHVNKTLFLSPDIHERALINRFISLQTNLPLSIINSGNPNDVEMKKIMDAATHLAEKKILINADYFHDPEKYLLFIENVVQHEKLEVVIIDNITSFGNRLKSHHHRHVSQLMRGLKKIAREYNIAILLSCSVSSLCEKKMLHKRPELTHISEQGEIKENADKIIFIYRPMHYGMMYDSIGNSVEQLMEWIIIKNKTGPVGTAKFQFDNTLLHLSELD
jgi:replicative DNA helicase